MLHEAMHESEHIYTAAELQVMTTGRRARVGTFQALQCSEERGREGGREGGKDSVIVVCSKRGSLEEWGLAG